MYSRKDAFRRFTDDRSQPDSYPEHSAFTQISIAARQLGRTPSLEGYHDECRKYSATVQLAVPCSASISPKYYKYPLLSEVVCFIVLLLPRLGVMPFSLPFCSPIASFISFKRSGKSKHLTN